MESIDPGHQLRSVIFRPIQSCPGLYCTVLLSHRSADEGPQLSTGRMASECPTSAKGHQ
ncbi:hypothetical protein VFPPC_16929 [Pochonia chlamydosporia 170]|uniref:Uncharacterized protein n=1 Tax=Pochonia chlamydosporia 170 TaxID=1380566 RepID=A0A179F107_METCM|nr:hypothetical protein VFPPC_16929 [Pochonia chlamydosporia 170]OAQ58829.1 hypothetical protein VFPPC_16929 [Pochonia chlamydosporia 170]